MKDELVEMICKRLERDKKLFQEQFSKINDGLMTRSVIIDELLPRELAIEIFEKFPGKENMRCFSSFRETKYTSKEFDSSPVLLRDITFAIQDRRVVALVEEITGIPQQIPDSSLYAGGLSLMEKGNFLNPHIDNSHDSDRKYYRSLNLLYYVTPEWKTEYGGNLELWDENVTKPFTISSLFNRLVIMETNLNSWHSVSPVLADSQRCCVSNYYFSKASPGDKEYFHVTSFSARPNQLFRRAAAKIDNFIRNGARTFIRKGIGKHDLYEPKQ